MLCLYLDVLHEFSHELYTIFTHTYSSSTVIIKWLLYIHGGGEIEVTRKYRKIKVQQELVDIIEREVGKNKVEDLTTFVSESIKDRLAKLQKDAASDYSEKSTLIVPEETRFDKEHMWCMVTSDTEVLAGLSSYAQSKLGEFALIQTYPVGTSIRKGESMGIVETWLFTYDLFSPVSGKIVEINNELAEDASVLGVEPHSLKWIFRIKSDNQAKLSTELGELMKPKEYAKYLLPIKYNRK